MSIPGFLASPVTKGGAAGGGYSQVLPMEEINLFFTGDFPAVTTAHNLLSAMVDAHVHNGNELNLDVRSIWWPRAVDMNDRALREIVVGLGGASNGYPREDRFVITPASEVMAILCLARSLEDLRTRLGRIVVGTNRAGEPVTAEELKAAGAMAVLLKDAIRPNLVQTLEGGPAFVHGGPFGNIAHGCSSLVATRSALGLADYVVTEAGFGSDLGAEKFFDIKCRVGGLNPEAAVLVATVRSLKMQGGADKKELTVGDTAALERGLPHLLHHIRSVQQFGVPVVVAINRFIADTEAELMMVNDYAAKAGVRVALCEVWEKGGAGGEALARDVLSLLDGRTARFAPIYDVKQPVRAKIETIVKKVYGGDGVDYSPAASKAIDGLEAVGLHETPVCMAKTQYSLTDDPTKLGTPRGFRITVNEVYGSAGAGFVVCKTGDIMTMPGLPKVPAAEGMSVKTDGQIVGLS